MFPPLLWLSIAFIVGIALAAHLQLSLLIWAVLAFTALVLLILQPRLWPSPENSPAAGTSRFSSILPRRLFTPAFLFFACLLSLFAGAARYQLTVPKSDIRQVSWFNDRKYDVVVSAVVADPPDVRDTYTNLRLQVQGIHTGKRSFEVGGLLLARVPANAVFQYGQKVRLRGRLETPPDNEDFSYLDYLARQGIYSLMPDAQVTVLPGTAGNPLLAAVYSFKSKLVDNVYRIFVDPEASLLAGILLGVDAGLPGPLQQAFKDTGTAHIIAISGFNIAIIAGIFILLFGRLFGPRWGAILSVIGIAFYTVLAGAGPSVVRAALMGMLGLFALQFGRRQMGLNTLAFVGAAMAFWNPNFLWDVGFQLSFFATLGLILYGAPFQSWAERQLARFFPASQAAKGAGYLAEWVLLTLAAQLTTLPIMAYHFQQISLVSFIANPFILPAQPAVMVLGGLAVFGSLIAIPLGRLLGLLAWPLTAYTIRMVELFDSLPHGVIYLGSVSLGFVIVFYVVLLGVTLEGSRIRNAYNWLRARFRFLTVSLVLASLFACTLLTWRAAAARPDGKLHITFISVGSADAMLVTTSQGRHLLINGGPSVSALSDALGRRVSILSPSLDWLIMASTDEQEVAALPRLLPRYPPSSVLVAGNPGASFSSRAVMQWAEGQSIPIKQAGKGELLDLGGGALLRVIDVSARGATLLISWDKFHLLLPIGANLDTLDALQNGEAVGPIDVLSLAQSGYGPLSPPEWIGALNPHLTVISVAAGDIDGRPDKDVLTTLAGRSILRTDVNGWIDVSTDGTQMWVNVERQPKEIGPTPGK